MNITEAKELLLKEGAVRYTSPSNKNQTESSFGINPCNNGKEKFYNLINSNKELNSLYKQYPDERVFVYCMKYDLMPEDIPRCPICNDFCKLNDVGSKYFRRTCGKIECQNAIKKNQSLAIYGTSNVSQSGIIKDRKSQTCFEHFGVPWHLQADSVKDQIDKTNRLRNGDLYKEKRINKTKATIKKKYGVSNISQAKGIQSKKSFRFWFQNIRFDSSYELCFFLYHIENNIPIERCSDQFPYYDSNNTEHWYHPDFKVNGEFVEVKGEHLLDKQGNLTSEIYSSSKESKDINFHKQKCMEKVGSRLISSEEIQKCFNFIYEKYGKKYINSFKKAKKKFKDPTSKEISLQNFLEARNISYEINVSIKNCFYPFVIYKDYKPLILIGNDKNPSYKFISYNSILENIVKELAYDLNLLYEKELKILQQTCSIFPSFDVNLKEEFSKLQEKDLKDIEVGNNIIRHFHKSLFTYCISNKLSPLDNWKDQEKIKERIRDEYIENNSTTSEQILFSFEEAPVIRTLLPFFCKNEVNVYLNDCNTIIDPYLDFSSKLLGTCSLGKTYTGYSNNAELLKESKNLINFLELNAKVFDRKEISVSNFDGMFTYIEDSNLWKDINKEYRDTDILIEECLNTFKCKRYLFIVNNTEKYKEFVTGAIENTSQFNDNNKKYIVLIDTKVPWHRLKREKAYIL